MSENVYDIKTNHKFRHWRVELAVEGQTLAEVKIYRHLPWRFIIATTICYKSEAKNYSLRCIPYSQLALCVKWTYNVHYYRIYKEHRNLGIRKHVTTSCSGTKLFY